MKRTEEQAKKHKEYMKKYYQNNEEKRKANNKRNNKRGLEKIVTRAVNKKETGCVFFQNQRRPR